MTLRRQLLLVALVVLLLPLTGWQLVRVMEELLRAGQEEAVLARAEALSRAVAGEAPLPVPGAAMVLYARRIGYPVLVDGYDDDWDLWLPWAQAFGADSTRPAPVRALFARHDRHLYGLIRVRDATPRYFAPEKGVAGSDHVRFTLGTPRRDATFTVSTAAPGSIEAGDGPYRLQGEWRETGEGYLLEFRLPAAAVERGIGFAVFDAATGAGGRPLAGTGEAGREAAVLPLVGPDPDRERRLAALAPSGARLWLFDSRGWVLGRAGSFFQGTGERAQGSAGWLSTLAYRYLLAPPLDEPRPRPDVAARLAGEEIESARAGRAAVRWLSVPGESTVLASVAVPITGEDGRVSGVLLLERPTEALPAFASAAVMRLIGLTLVAFGLAALALLAFASVLSLRIRRLRDAAEHTLTPDGRLRSGFPVSRARDEVGDLGRSFARLLGELRAHTDYLRTLADKLSHELRTPIAMVRSSLDNLESEPLGDDARRYARRAREGAERMSGIVRAMAEASRIEQSVRETAAEDFDLGELVRTQVGAWRELRADRRFELHGAGPDMPVRASPELVSRLLDKLVENAVDFTPRGGLIRVGVHAEAGAYRLTVFNEGSSLPQELEGRLFESMTSGRRRAGERAHLGLGLYVARLIAEHHGGAISAHNVEGGVMFEVVLGKG